jgi:hypothetical protein
MPLPPLHFQTLPDTVTTPLVSRMFHDPVIASWVQAAIYLLTLIVLIAQARILIRQTRSQEQALRLQTDAFRQGDYLRCQIDYSESARVILASGLHATVYDELANGGSRFAHWAIYKPEQKAAYAYLELIYELFERIFVLDADGWIGKDEWPLWDTWFKDVLGHPLLRDVFEDNVGMYDPRFEAFVRSALDKVAGSEANSNPEKMD